MKAVYIVLIIVLAALVYYNHFSSKDSLEYITIENDTVTVDVKDYVAKFSASREFRETYMIFGGSYFKNKKLINPIWLSGLEIADAQNIYARYPDFHRCSSPGAELAKPKAENLNLIPANEEVLDELKESIEEFEDNFAAKGDRVCVSLTGKSLDMESANIPEENIDIKDRLPAQAYYLINSSKRVNCKNLLDQK